MDFEAMMAATAGVNLEDVLHDCRPLLVVYKDGRVERFLGMGRLPPSVDSITGVESKDVVIDPETGVFVRLYEPPNVDRVGVIVYYHGGGFCVESTTSPLYHNYCNSLSFEAKMIVVSVEYRLAPEHPFPIGYEDCWAGLKWVFKDGQNEPWIREHGDLTRVFLAGDSAGGNIVHNVAKRVGSTGNIAVKGIVLVDPYFWGRDKIGSEERLVEPIGWYSLCDKIWLVACPSTSGFEDPQINPGRDPELGDLAVEKVMVSVAEEDVYRDRGYYYRDLLLKTGFKGDVQVLENLGENHVFHLFKPTSPKSQELMKKIAAFLNS